MPTLYGDEPAKTLTQLQEFWRESHKNSVDQSNPQKLPKIFAGGSKTCSTLVVSFFVAKETEIADLPDTAFATTYQNIALLSPVRTETVGIIKKISDYAEEYKGRYPLRDLFLHYCVKKLHNLAQQTECNESLVEKYTAEYSFLSQVAGSIYVVFPLSFIRGEDGFHSLVLDIKNLLNANLIVVKERAQRQTIAKLVGDASIISLNMADGILEIIPRLLSGLPLKDNISLLDLVTSPNYKKLKTSNVGIWLQELIKIRNCYKPIQSALIQENRSSYNNGRALVETTKQTQMIPATKTDDLIEWQNFFLMQKTQLLQNLQKEDATNAVDKQFRSNEKALNALLTVFAMTGEQILLTSALESLSLSIAQLGNVQFVLIAKSYTCLRDTLNCAKELQNRFKCAIEIIKNEYSRTITSVRQDNPAAMNMLACSTFSLDEPIKEFEKIENQIATRMRQILELGASKCINQFLEQQNAVDHFLHRQVELGIVQRTNHTSHTHADISNGPERALLIKPPESSAQIIPLAITYPNPSQASSQPDEVDNLESASERKEFLIELQKFQAILHQTKTALGEYARINSIPNEIVDLPYCEWNATKAQEQRTRMIRTKVLFSEENKNLWYCYSEKPSPSVAVFNFCAFIFFLEANLNIISSLFQILLSANSLNAEKYFDSMGEEKALLKKYFTTYQVLSTQFGDEQQQDFENAKIWLERHLPEIFYRLIASEDYQSVLNDYSEKFKNDQITAPISALFSVFRNHYTKFCSVLKSPLSLPKPKLPPPVPQRSMPNIVEIEVEEIVESSAALEVKAPTVPDSAAPSSSNSDFSRSSSTESAVSVGSIDESHSDNETSTILTAPPTQMSVQSQEDHKPPVETPLNSRINISADAPKEKVDPKLVAPLYTHIEKLETAFKNNSRSCLQSNYYQLGKNKAQLLNSMMLEIQNAPECLEEILINHKKDTALTGHRSTFWRLGKSKTEEIFDSILSKIESNKAPANSNKI